MGGSSHDDRDDRKHQVRLSLDEARGVMLAAQGLFDLPPAHPDLEEVQSIIDRLGVIQIDTISVIERSQYLVLWSRLGVYNAGLLDILLSSKRVIFEYWSHAASLVPMRDYPYYRADMVRGYEHHLWSNISDWMRHNPDVVKQTLEQIRTSGAMASADFESPAEVRRSAPWEWYGPKESRRALHTLWTTGELMISSRRGGQKVYDLRERILAEAIEALGGVVPSDAALPTIEEQSRYFVERTVHALGILTPSWLWDYFRMRPQLQTACLGTRQVAARLAARTMLDELVERGLVLPVMVAGIKEPAYLAIERLPDLERQRTGDMPLGTTLLSPFDNLLWHRLRTKELFGYDVCFEAYVVPEKRRYGYYCLAILHCGRIVGRVDVKALRSESLLLARAIYLEPGITPERVLVDGLAGAMRDLAGFLRLDTIHIERSEPEILVARLNKRLSLHLPPASNRLQMVSRKPAGL